MSKEHPVPEDFERFLQPTSRATAPADSAWLVRHLLAGCSTCQKNLSAQGWTPDRIARLLLWPSLEALSGEPGTHPYRYDQAFAQSEGTLAELLAADAPAERAPAELFAELAAQSAEEQLRRVAGEPRYASPQLVRWLVASSHAERYKDAETMLHLAHLAQAAAEACQAGSLGCGVGSERRLADLRTQAWGQFGNALRVNGRLREAEEAFHTARRYRDQGTGDPALRAHLLDQTASLKMIFQQNFESAIELAQQAGGIYRDLGDTHKLASTLVLQAIALLHSGQAERAAEVLNQAIPLMDHEEDPHLLLAACHNLVICYSELDQPEQGLALYFKAQDLYREFTDPLILLRMAWQEGRLLRDLGHLRAAETVLTRARKGFVELGLAYEVALVSLDLSAVYARLSAVAELQQMVAESIPIFRSLRVSREVLASLLQLQQVADQEHKALELIRFLTAQLDLVPNRHSPTLQV